MHVARIKGATRVLGKSQGYFGLPVLDQTQHLAANASIPMLITVAQSLRQRWNDIPELPPAFENLASDTADFMEQLASALELLPVRDETKDLAIAGDDVQTVTTAWLPTPDELKALNAGASIYVELVMFGNAHPPIKVGIGELPE